MSAEDIAIQSVESPPTDTQEVKEQPPLAEVSPEERLDIRYTISRYISLTSYYDNPEESDGQLDRAKSQDAKVAQVALELFGSDPIHRSGYLRLLDNMQTPGAYQALERLLTKFEDDGAGYGRDIVCALGGTQRLESVEPISQYAQTVLRNSQQLLQRMKQGDLGVMGSLTDLTYYFRYSMSVLNDYKNPEVLSVTKPLYEQYQAFQEEFKEAQVGFRLRVRSIIQPGAIPVFDDFPAATEQESRYIRESIREMVSGGQDVAERLLDIKILGEKAVPYLYDAALTGTLKPYDVARYFRTQEVVPQDRLVPLYEQLLLEMSWAGKNTCCNDLLELIGESSEPRTEDFIAEYARLNAEMYLEAVVDDDKVRHQAAIMTSVRILNQISSAKSLEYSKLLKLAYAEVFPGYSGVTALVEDPLKVEKSKWAHDSTFIRGSALFASMLDRGKEKVRDVDIFVSDPRAPKTEIQSSYFSKIDDIEHLFDKEEYARIVAWLDKNGYRDKKINLVRVNPDDLELEQTFHNEPKLLIWDMVYQDDRTYLGLDERAAYARGELIRNKDGLDFVSANTSLARALRVMDLAKRFELNHETTILVEAEKQVKERELIITPIPAGRDTRRGESYNNVTLDPTFFKVLLDKDLRKSLIQNHQRLGNLADEIIKATGMRKGQSIDEIGEAITTWINSNYGEVYTKVRGYVRLYDIKLTNSEAPASEQESFIRTWYAAPREVNSFQLGTMSRVEGDFVLPLPQGFDSILDHDLLAKSVEGRATKQAFLDVMSGHYRIEVGAGLSPELDAKIATFLKIARVDLPLGQIDKTKIGRTLIRAGVDPRNPVLAQFDQKESHQVDLFISAKPEDILAMSDGKPWTSCMAMAGAHGTEYIESLYGDVEQASVIAYVMDGDNYLARKVLRATRALDTMGPGVAIESTLGDWRYEVAMEAVIEHIAAQNNLRTNTPMMTYPFRYPGVHFGRSSISNPNGNFFYYT